MILKFKKLKQNEIITQAITKAGSERKLATLTGIPNGTIYKYKFEITNIPEDRLKKILNFIDKKIDDYKCYILNELPNNWGQVKGGINCIAKKKKNGNFIETVERLKKVSSKRMKKWHKDMKKNSPRKYHIWQYERFKMVGRGYAYNLMNEIPVRNQLEKMIGDFLILQGFNFEYEPYLNIHGKVYFPDFKIKEILIEVTEWAHPNKDKLKGLKKKLKDYQKNNFKIILFIPINIRKFYKEMEGYCHIKSTLPDLKEFLNASVA